MLKPAACLMVLFCLVVVPAAHSQFLTAVKPIPGYVCMRLNLPRDKMVSRDLDVPIFAEPSLRAPKIGQAAATLIVRSPMRVENGFAEILFLDGRVAWIQKDLLRPYATPEAPDAHCTPSIMSNGRPGFG